MASSDQSYYRASPTLAKIIEIVGRYNKPTYRENSDRKMDVAQCGILVYQLLRYDMITPELLRFLPSLHNKWGQEAKVFLEDSIKDGEYQLKHAGKGW